MTSPFLWLPGTNGLLISSPLTLLSTELNALASGASATSAVGGPSSNGIFNQTNTGSGLWGYMQLTLGSIAGALANGSVASGWFLKSFDGGATFEVADADSPHFYIALPATAITAGTKRGAMGQIIQLPAVSFKVQLQQITTQSFAGSGNTLVIAPVAPAT